MFWNKKDWSIVFQWIFFFLRYPSVMNVLRHALNSLPKHPCLGLHIDRKYISAVYSTVFWDNSM